MSLSSEAYLGSHSTLSQWARSARAAWLALLVWIGPLSRTRTIGLSATPDLGPKRRSTSSRRAMKSELRLVVNPPQPGRFEQRPEKGGEAVTEPARGAIEFGQ